ncbi:family 16 glycoside hydrolase [Actinomycetes bacterium KLBMP 9797]
MFTSHTRRLLTAAATAVTLLISTGASANAAPSSTAVEQVLTWTADDSFTEYRSAPATAVAGPATLVFENSAATGNTTGMQHTLTFETGNPAYNSDVDVNILADPFDSNGGRWTVDVVLTPGTYRYFCAIPGHGTMTGLLVVTGSGADTTPPTVTASVTGERDANGAYIGTATVALSATDAGSGVARIEYAVDGGAFSGYEAPVPVSTPGPHTVAYRATDVAGNTSEPGSVSFVVVEATGPDTTPPVATASVSGERDADGGYVGSALVTLSATDADSGVARIEYAVDGAAYRTYTAPVTVDQPGQHTVAYRATDAAGNTSAPRSVSFTVVSAPQRDCPVTDTRPVVWVGTINSGVPNRMVASGCTINNAIEDERAWLNHGQFVAHATDVAERLHHLGVISHEEHATLVDAAERSGVGKPDGRNGYRGLLDRSGASFALWEQVGAGGFSRNADGSITSRPVGGLGMLWFPVRAYGDFSLKLQWRDDAPGDGRANSGVFVRFPHVHQHPDESRPEWVAIKYGHELQILDRPDGDQYKSGSVYGFDRVDLAGAGVTPKGTWNDYEIRVVGQHYSVFRNGVLINEYHNTPDAVFDPPRPDDPGGAGRQHTSGYIGVQNHGATDVVSFRNIRIAPLS